MEFNDWWLSLPEGRRKVLIDDKWALANAAYQASQNRVVGLEKAMLEILQLCNQHEEE